MLKKRDTFYSVHDFIITELKGDSGNRLVQQLPFSWDKTLFVLSACPRSKAATESWPQWFILLFWQVCVFLFPPFMPLSRYRQMHKYGLRKFKENANISIKLIDICRLIQLNIFLLCYLVHVAWQHRITSSEPNDHGFTRNVHIHVKTHPAANTWGQVYQCLYC